MARSTPTKPYIIEGVHKREFKTLNGLLRACARASKNDNCGMDNGFLRVQWPEGLAFYTITETDDAFYVDEQLGWDL